MLAAMTADYLNLSVADRFILVVPVEHKLYAIDCAPEMALSFASLSTSSKGDPCLRFRPKSDTCYDIRRMANRVVWATEEELAEFMAETGINSKGDAVEAWVCDAYGAEWHGHNSEAFYQNGDFTADGVRYQVKYYGATYCTTTSLANAHAKLGR